MFTLSTPAVQADALLNKVLPCDAAATNRVKVVIKKGTKPFSLALENEIAKLQPATKTFSQFSHTVSEK